MGVLRERIFEGMGKLISGRWRQLAMVCLGGTLVVLMSQTAVWAMQKHTLLDKGQSAGTAGHAQTLQQVPQTTHAAPTSQAQTPATQSVAPAPSHQLPATGAQEKTRQTGQTAVPTAQSQQHTPPVPTAGRPSDEGEHMAPPAGSPEAEHEAVAAHGEAEAEHGVVLPEISPIAGVTFVETVIDLMQYELQGRFLGWRPNDLVFGRFTDNINNYQLGVLEAMRFTTLRLKDSLTRMGEADTYDRDLESALNLFMNKATLFWFPSAESSYAEAVDHLKAFLKKLKTGRRNFYYRVDNLLSLIASYGDLLGNVNKSLAVQVNPDGSQISWFESDDYFYYAKGVSHVIYEIMKVVRVGYQDQLITLDAIDILDEILHELHTADTMDPWLILNSDLDGFFANHRANLNAPLSEVAHLMSILSRF